MSADHVTLITGAAGGLGREAAKAFVLGGSHVALVDRDEAGLEETASILRASGALSYSIETYAADVTDECAVAAYFDAAAHRLGPIKSIFNNAGIEGAIQPIATYPTELFDRVMDINVRGVWLNLKYGLKTMLASGISGSIINTASGAALVGNRNAAPYAASKHAVLGLTRSAALEVAASGIRVNAICPGPIDTRMMRSIEEQHSQPEGSAHTSIVRNIPAGRYGTAEEVAKLVVFLASDDARYINGAAVSIDGALTAQ